MSRQASALCAVFGGLAVLIAFAVYMSERDRTDPNYSLALLSLGVGAFLVLIAVISNNGRQPES